MDKWRDGTMTYAKAVVRGDGAVFRSLSEAANKTPACLSSVCQACKGLRAKAGGYTWKYLESSDA